MNVQQFAGIQNSCSKRPREMLQRVGRIDSELIATASTKRLDIDLVYAVDDSNRILNTFTCFFLSLAKARQALRPDLSLI